MSSSRSGCIDAFMASGILPLLPECAGVTAFKEQYSAGWSAVLFFNYRLSFQHVSQFRPKPSQHLILGLAQAPGVMPNSRHTSSDDRSSTMSSQNACQVRF